MICPSCGGRTHVTETRDAGDIVYRTRRCDPCEWIITSKEKYINGLMPKDAIKPRDWREVRARRVERAANAER